MSPSSRRVWIEIRGRNYITQRGWVALLAEGVDRNFNAIFPPPCGGLSPSSRRAWIEISAPFFGL